MASKLISLALLMLDSAAVSAQSPQGAASDDPIYKLLPIIISLAAFLFSMISLTTTLIFQYLQKPRMKIAVGRTVQLFLKHDGGPAVTLTVTLFNGGAKYGAIYDISGDISDGTGRSEKINWRFFVESKDIGELGKQLKPFNAFAGMAETIVVPNRQAISKRIQFDTPSPFELRAGIYTVNIFCYEIHKRRKPVQTRFTFTFTDQDAEKYLTTKAAGVGQPSQGSITLNLTFADR